MASKSLRDNSQDYLDTTNDVITLKFKFNCHKGHFETRDEGWGESMKELAGVNWVITA